MILRKYQQGGDLSPENLDGIISGEVMPQTGAEARAAAQRAGKKSYYWAGSTIPLTDQDAAIQQAAGSTEIPTARSRAIAEAKLSGAGGYNYGGVDLPYPPTSAAPAVQDAWGINPGEDLSYANLDGIISGEVMPQTRDEAFAAARRAGKSAFDWGGQSFHTKTKEDVEREQRAAQAPVQAPSPDIVKSSTPTEAPEEKQAPAVDLLSSAVADSLRKLIETDEFQGILRGPERRKANRQNRQENRRENRAKRQVNRKENKAGRKENRADRKNNKK